MKCGAPLHLPDMPSPSHQAATVTSNLTSSSGASIEPQLGQLHAPAIEGRARPWPIKYVVRGGLSLIWICAFLSAIAHQAAWAEVSDYIGILLVGIAVCYEPNWSNVGRFNLIKWPLIFVAFVLHMTQYGVEANAGVIVGQITESAVYVALVWFFLWAFLKRAFRNSA